MTVGIDFREKQVKQLETAIGVYVLSDLDNVPVYVGKSGEGIRARVRRHITSARSDIIANRQLDVWEIAYVWAYPTNSVKDSDVLESALYHHFNARSQLMNGKEPTLPPQGFFIPEPSQVLQVMTDEDIQDRKREVQRLPRQATHYAQMVGHFMSVKNSTQIANAMNAHFDRLKTYHQNLLAQAESEPE